MQKRNSLLAVLLLAALLLSACGTDFTETTVDTPAAESAVQNDTAPNVETETEARSAIDQMEAADFGGRDVHMLVRREFLYEFSAEETGDIVSDAVHSRNLEIADRLNMHLIIDDAPGSWSESGTFLAVLSGDVLSQGGMIDAVASAANYMLPTIPNGYFFDLCNTPYVALSEPWWSQGYVENMTIDQSLYLATGTASLNLLDNMCTVFFNKQIAADRGADSPYEAVKNGSWTFDKILAMTEGFTLDVNDDKKLDLNDQIGILSYNNMNIAQQVAFGLHFSERDADGYPQITYMDERMTKAFDLIRDCIAKKQLCVYNPGTDTLSLTTDMQKAFQNETVYFMYQVLSSAAVMREMEADFGILPMPKLDDTQDRYYTCVLENLTVLGIPVSVTDVSASGALIEALARVGYDTVTPVYYEKALGSKYVRDNDSAEMLDLIYDSVWFDFAYLNSVSLDGINHLFNKSLDGSLVSNFEAKKAVFEKKLTELLDGYRALKE